MQCRRAAVPPGCRVGARQPRAGVGWNTLTLDDYIIPPPRKPAKSLAPHAPEGCGAAACGAGTEAAV
ncbi:MAG: hypothetical protein J0M33_26000 [Anaerolineae bacterium]|nr:hypothetical protein [Anaerolineae bacterium]